MIGLDRAAPLPEHLARALDEPAVLESASPFGARVLYYPVASSTNDLAAALASRGTPDGTIVVAREQTAGRGRGGHTWFSPPATGLYLSAVLVDREGFAPDWGQVLTLAMGVALAEGLHAASGLPVLIKWPNDLVMAPAGTVRGARKLAGILAEALSIEGRLSHVVLGIGVNVAAAAWPPEISTRVTSLEEELGRDVDLGLVFGLTLARMGTWVRRLRAGQSAAVRDRWQRLAVGASGATVEIVHPEGARRGITCGIDPSGALLVRSGVQTERVVGGEVTWL